VSDKLRFGSILVRAGVLEESDLQALVQSHADSPMDIGEVIVAEGLLDEASMLRTISKSLNLPAVNLDTLKPDERAIALVSRELCVEHFLLPIEVERSRSGEHLHVAMANPSDVKAIKRVTRAARLRIRPLVASAREIRHAIQRHYGGPTIPGPSTAPKAEQPEATGLGLGAELTPAPIRAPAPPEPAASGGAKMSNIFDFGVTDLSDLSEEPGDTLAGSGPGHLELGVGRPALPSAPPLNAPAPPPASRVSVSRSPAPESPSRSGSMSPFEPRGRSQTDLLSALEDSAQASLVGSGDLGDELAPAPPPPGPAPSAPGGGARGEGFYVRARRRTNRPSARPEPAGQSTAHSGGLPPLPSRPPGSPKSPGPLPPLPPSMGARGTRRPVSSPPVAPPLPPPSPASPPEGFGLSPAPEGLGVAPSTPPPRARGLDPFEIGSAPPAHEPHRAASSTPLAALPDITPPPVLPAGMVDDIASTPLDLRSILDRYADDLDEADGTGDEVLSRYLERFGQSTSQPSAEALFAVLDRALERTNSKVARLIIVLVRHLARRGLLDTEELLGELRED
jgi:hypothetical protein